MNKELKAIVSNVLESNLAMMSAFISLASSLTEEQQLQVLQPLGKAKEAESGAVRDGARNRQQTRWVTRTAHSMRNRTKIIAATIAVTLFAVFIVLNLGLGTRKITRQIEALYTVDDPQFVRTMGVMLGPAIVPGNRAETLLNGDRIFPAMLKAIREARKSISFETYIYWQGAIGRQFADALSERARAGVKVHVLIDWVGSGKIDEAYLKQLEQAGVAVRRYNRPHWYTFGRFNNRTHRKLLVVDGRIGFTGGVGIADVWSGTPRIRIIGATRTIAWKVRRWRRCSPRFTTTGWK